MEISNPPHISVVSPVYGCNKCLYELYSRLKETLEKLTTNFEIILVNDASLDNAWETIVELANKDNRVKGINFSRNFGQHYAITAGLDHCMGEWVVVMDCDLQDKPEEIIKLYGKAQEGFDIVFARRIMRKDHFVKKSISRLFYRVFNFLSDIKIDYTIANYGMYSASAIKNFLMFKESNKVFPISIRSIGFRTTAIDVLHEKRLSGKSSYNYAKLISLALKIIVSQSAKPLFLSIYFGFVIALCAFIFGMIIIIKYFIYNVPLGYTSIIITVLFIGGLLFLQLGLIGIYLGKIYDEVKKRPKYIVQEKTF
jgi:dolichol-phosphate mannosyltransferase